MWKHTIDGQWQPFDNYATTVVSMTEGLYKPSGLSTGIDHKCTDNDISDKKLSVSTLVCTSKGYGTIKELGEKEVTVKLNSSEEEKEEKEATVDITEARRKIEIMLRVL